MSTRSVGPRPFLLPLAAAALVAACGTDIVLPPATRPVYEQHITLYALSGTPVHLASAFNMLIGIEVRTDETNDFEFAFEIAPDSVLGLGTTGDTVAALLPRGALGFTPDGGLQHTTQSYDAILRAPLEGYVRDAAVRIDSGDVLLAASRLQSCNFNVIRPLVAKMRIDRIDHAQRSVEFAMTLDPNCGYLSLVADSIPRN